MEMAPDELRRRLERHGQDHVLAHWDQLSGAERRQFVADLSGLDFEELQRLHARRAAKDAIPDWQRLATLPRPAESAAELEQYRRLGEEALRAGEVAFLVVAGGQGTRLGFDAPKGMFPVGPVSGKTLFQLHAEKIQALSRRNGRPLPFLVMTSMATHQPTVEFFEQHANFGLAADTVRFFCQGAMPALDYDSGRLLLEAPGRLALSPNGHGGVLDALGKHDLYEWLLRRAVRTIYYFQVDNPLTNLTDAEFLGRHLGRQAHVSSKILPKRHPKEKMGNFVLVDGRCSIIEYSDLPDDWAHEKTPEGGLFFWGGNTAIHLFDVSFLQQRSAEAESLPWHLAKKKVAHLGPTGAMVEPETENALKFERFIFDVLPQTERWTIAATTRERDFEPLKNAEGDDSPATVRRALIRQAAKWLEQAGVAVPRNADGDPATPLEISPLVALDADELRQQLGIRPAIDGPLYLG